MNYFEEYRRRAPELVGHLLNAVRGGRLGHAFLIHSDSPAEREEFALALAMLAACPNPAPDGAPCGECAICRHVRNNTMTELYHLSPQGKMYQIQVGDRDNPEPNSVRDFERQFTLTSISGAARKIGIVHDADRMNPAAQNALLKTLEEPPRDTLIVLTSGNPESLLPTTRSRCQTLTLLRNRCDFRFEGAERVGPALAAAVFLPRPDLAAAERCARELVTVAAGLRAAAAARVEAAWAPRLEDAAKIDDGLLRRLTEQSGSESAGSYIRDRNDFLAAIHTFLAQLFLLAGGARAEDLPNPELLSGVSLPEKIDTARAAAWLREADELLFNLRFNVNEELALRTFAVNLVFLEN